MWETVRSKLKSREMGLGCFLFLVLFFFFLLCARECSGVHVEVSFSFTLNDRSFVHKLAHVSFNY